MVLNGDGEGEVIQIIQKSGPRHQPSTNNRIKMIFEHVTTFPLIFLLSFTLSFYYFDFCATSYYFFVNYVVPQIINQINCLNNTPKILINFFTNVTDG